MRNAVLLSSLLLLLCACQTPIRAYDGPKRASADVAILHANPAGAYIAFRLRGVDDMEVDVQRDPVALLPGERTLHLDVTPTPLTAWDNIRGQQASVTQDYDRRHLKQMTISFTAQAGRRYAINGRMNTGTGMTEIWVFDQATDEKVASARDPRS